MPWPDLADPATQRKIAAGRYAEFHAMRHTYITRLGVADMPLTVAQRLARHSTLTLTANTYTYVGLADGRAALERAFKRPTI